MAASRGYRPFDRALRVAVAGAGRDASVLRRAIRAARAAGTRRRALEEIGLMLMLYAGYPAALETLRALQSVWPRRARRSHDGGPARWRRRGEALCRRIYGPRYPRLVASVRALHPDLAVWMVEQGYGRVLARPGLSASQRSLVTVAVLAATGRERQLVSHLFGARRLGLATDAVRRAWAVGADAAAALARPGPAGHRALAERAWRTAFASPGVSAASQRRARVDRIRGTS